MFPAFFSSTGRGENMTHFMLYKAQFFTKKMSRCNWSVISWEEESRVQTMYCYCYSTIQIFSIVGYLEGESLSFTTAYKWLKVKFILHCFNLYSFFNFQFQGGLTYCTMKPVMWKTLSEKADFESLETEFQRSKKIHFL